MDVVSFRNFSDALVPLPALPVDRSDAASSSRSSASASFRDELDSRLESLSSGDSTWPFDLGSAAEPTDEGSDSRPLLVGTGAADSDRVDEELMAACRDVEGFLLGLLLRSLGKSLPGGDLFSQTWESGVYRDMFFMELAQSIGSQPPGLGIADMLYQDIMLKAGGSVDRTA
jgi:hypothetical protein